MKYYAVNYSGFWVIQLEDYYGGNNILNAEDVGEKQAEKNAEMIVDLLNKEQEGK